MKAFTIRHATTYRYARPVGLGEHRLMVRPRDSHDLRLVSSRLILSPRGSVRWLHDVFGNSVAVASFAEPADELHVESILHLERYVPERPKFALDEIAATYPFVYAPEDRIDLGRMLESHHPDPGGTVAAWARGFVARRGTDTLALLADINAGIKRGFSYGVRHEEGTQTAAETLRLGSGTCRDFALLFVEAVRALGFGARFVSGYLYDPKLDAGSGAVQGPDAVGSGATHAWADVYLPGAGWVEYDPTNAIVAGEGLIRVAVTRDPSQAVPVAGSYVGAAEDFLGMEVVVSVTADRAGHAPPRGAMAAAA